MSEADGASRRRGLRRRGLAVAGALGAAWLAVAFGAGAGRAGASAGQPAAPCLIAEVGGVDVTTDDSAGLRALVFPAPSEAQARRLAVDAALARASTDGQLAGSSAQARLAAYRDLLGKLEREGASGRSLAERALAHLSEARAHFPVRPGPCYAGRDREVK